MKIVFLTKRRYTGRDLINDRYGRLFEFVSGLGRRGHRLAAICIEYGRPTAMIPPSSSESPNVDWHLNSTGAGLLFGLRKHANEALHIAAAFGPDVILSASDAFNVWLGDRLARRLAVPHVADLYDNFESFGATSLPGVKWAFRRALRGCEGIVAVSAPLASLVTAGIRPRGPVMVVGNGVDPTRFHRGDRRAARQAFGLPADALLIGTAGSLSRSRSIDDLFTAYMRLRKVDDRVSLVLAGQLGRDVALPKVAGITYLGDLQHDQVPLLLQALDVGVVCNRDSAFGRYCYPQKAVEMLSCGLPIVMADVGVARELVGGCRSTLYRPGDSRDLANAIGWQLANRFLPNNGPWDWDSRVRLLADLLERVSTRRRPELTVDR
jgi:teichuronic acid biosynthesis glycosyltransferase TuaC